MQQTQTLNVKCYRETVTLQLTHNPISSHANSLSPRVDRRGGKVAAHVSIFSYCIYLSACVYFQPRYRICKMILYIRDQTYIRYLIGGQTYSGSCVTFLDNHPTCYIGDKQCTSSASVSGDSNSCSFQGQRWKKMLKK